jgi:hypothetical protein
MLQARQSLGKPTEAPLSEATSTIEVLTEAPPTGTSPRSLWARLFGLFVEAKGKISQVALIQSLWCGACYPRCRPYSPHCRA